MTRYRILVVDNEVGMLEVCRDILSRLPHVDIHLQQDSLKAAEQLEMEAWDLLIADIRMPGLNGIDLLRGAREHDPLLASLIITAFPSVETAVDSMKLGATDYITKPFLPDDLLATVRQLLESKKLRAERDLLSRHLEKPYAFGEIIGASAAMRSVFSTIQKVAATTADVLVVGETGTGKELVARSIHRHSDRSSQRFVPVDCGAIPEGLLESEFFGYERGAFTGAVARSIGLMEFANEGTFFLDEIGELPPMVQSKLLRALQERKIRRVGGKNEIDLDVRIIAATARDLPAEIGRKRFRSDLFYRINVARIQLPPLRDRVEDIPLLASHFVDQFKGESGREEAHINDEAQEVLQAYAWPGNIRELQNVIRRTLAMTDHDAITVEDLPDDVVAQSDVSAGVSRSGFFALRDQRLLAFEKQYLHELMLAHSGDVPIAAAEAQVPRGTLYRLLKKHELGPADYRS